MTWFSYLCGCALIAQTPQTALVQLTHDQSTSRAPSWHPDGTQLAFETDRHGNWDIFVIDRATGVQSPLTVATANDRYPAWSPTGHAVVFVSDRGGSPDLHLLDVRTGRVEQLTTLAGEELFPAWSPDGRSVAFSLAADDEVHLMTLTLDGRSVTSMLVEAHRSLWPRWSPRGAEVAFFSRRDTDGEDDEVYVLSSSTGVIRRVTHHEGHDFCPTWNPAGTRIALVSLFSDGSRALRIVAPTDGVEHGQIAANYFRVTEPAWSPDGRYIAYAARPSSVTPYQLYVELVPEAAR